MDKAYADYCRADYCRADVFNPVMDEVLAQLEKKNIGDFFFEPDVVDPGFDNTDGPLDRVLSNLEK